MPQGKFDYDLDTQVSLFPESCRLNLILKKHILICIRFFPLFSSYIYALVNDEASLVHSTRSVLEDFANDGCVYLELRTTPRAIASVNITKSDYVRLILDTIAISSTQSRMHTKLILSVDRRNTAEEADHVIDLAIKFKEQGVVGVDLCGDPSKGDVTTFRSAFNRAKAAGLNITLHFAEIASQADDRRFGMQEGELMELLKWEPDRIGHVIHVPQQVKDVIKQKKIGLELCLSCNVHAKMMVGGKGGYADHHFGEWIRSDCPIFLCVCSFIYFPILRFDGRAIANIAIDGRRGCLWQSVVE